MLPKLLFLEYLERPGDSIGPGCGHEAGGLPGPPPQGQVQETLAAHCAAADDAAPGNLSRSVLYNDFYGISSDWQKNFLVFQNKLSLLQRISMLKYTLILTSLILSFISDKKIYSIKPLNNIEKENKYHIL